MKFEKHWWHLTEENDCNVQWSQMLSGMSTAIPLPLYNNVGESCRNKCLLSLKIALDQFSEIDTEK